MNKLLFCLLFFAAAAMAAGKSIYDFSLNTIDGQPASLSAYKGKVVMLVNVASKCGYTPQYTALESIYEKYKDQGFLLEQISRDVSDDGESFREGRRHHTALSVPH